MTISPVVSALGLETLDEMATGSVSRMILDKASSRRKSAHGFGRIRWSDPSVNRQLAHPSFPLSLPRFLFFTQLTHHQSSHPKPAGRGRGSRAPSASP
jgi:hypothetical protein